jgi:hydrogenase maturation protease
MNGGKGILVAGIGNIFFGDDAFGSEVARELMRRPLPDGVKVVDYGISSYDLAYAIMEGYDATILIDAVPRGEPAGTLYLIELDLENLGAAGHAIPDAHSMNPVSVLEMVKSMGGTTRQLYLVGCEPSVLESEEGRMGLSEVVQAAVPRVITMIESLLDDLLQNKIPVKINLLAKR